MSVGGYAPAMNMWRFHLAVAFLATALVACSAFTGQVGNPSVPAPARPVDLARYAGLWYELARYDNGFEKGCEGVTAEYRARDDGLIQVTNICRQGAPDGPVQVAEGRAKVEPDSKGTRLKVSFFGPFYVGDYWVLDHADDYGWSVVGEPSGRYLWILTRSAHPSDVLRAMLIARVKVLGYDTSLLRMTRQ